MLAKYAQAYARASSVSEGRVRTWISYMITAGVLERAAGDGKPQFIIKGGVALELRLRDRARATKDIDVVSHDTLPCLPLRLHIAQKLHGMTLPPRPGKRNERFRDLIDLLLMETLVTDYQGLREACEVVFCNRGTHSWPPPLDLPAHWVEPVTRLAQELNLPIADAHSGMARVQAFVERIIRA